MIRFWWNFNCRPKIDQTFCLWNLVRILLLFSEFWALKPKFWPKHTIFGPKKKIFRWWPILVFFGMKKYPCSQNFRACSGKAAAFSLDLVLYSQLVFSLIFEKKHVTRQFGRFGALGPPLSQYGYCWAYPTSPYAIFLLIVHAQVAPGPFLWWSDDFSIRGTC